MNPPDKSPKKIAKLPSPKVESSSGRRTISNNAARPQQPRVARAVSSPNFKDHLTSSSADNEPLAGLKKERLATSPQIDESPPFASIPSHDEKNLLNYRLSRYLEPGSNTSESLYETYGVRIERLKNFWFVLFALERILLFGSLACLDSWLYTFTILPLRFVKAFFILFESWVMKLRAEVPFLWRFVRSGVRRVWRRRRQPLAEVTDRRESEPDTAASSDTVTIDRDSKHRSSEPLKRRQRIFESRIYHRRRKMLLPSSLLKEEKADILKGLLMITTCSLLMFLDASRMYHWIRGQAAIKLYVIYNVLEVSDRLLSAVGQDILECLFSKEALERDSNGKIRISRPFWLFWTALVYTVVHSTSLYYQVMTLNVAVNSYSNALITLLLSNQFVEIKSTVFRKFEKENLFQLTCADIVERFQLGLMLTIIASRNFVETGAFNFIGDLGLGSGSVHLSTATNSTPLSTPPRTATSILPRSFTFFPSSIFYSVSSVNSFLPTFAQVLGPFLIVLGSEILVDWLKHAFINKFNNYRPALYNKYLDVLAKDYYTNAFGDQNLTRRIGLPVIPLSCLFFRVSVQTYQMFLESLLPQNPSSTALGSTSLTSIHDHYTSIPLPSMSPSILRDILPASAAYINALFQSLLENAIPSPARSVQIFTVILLLTGFIVLLIVKLLLGVGLLVFSRNRYKKMKSAEKEQRKIKTEFNVEGALRVGPWGMTEVTEQTRRRIYDDDPEGLRRLKEKEEKDKNKDGDLDIDRVQRYGMSGKKIW
ncbi:hypothetical protein N7495_003353 [Penicillium taxi]|uniref:uncharacterized protein n=1 Tax=Penicillium taxi TaxID=168475 RepID=UPI002544E560|nr:uncharacterized protein N7495_003353 [Penicillium taxi]KAJ5902825.1 hypothetical protein N7495_003353 [Penicillium taxi]